MLDRNESVLGYIVVTSIKKGWTILECTDERQLAEAFWGRIFATKYEAAQAYHDHLVMERSQIQREINLAKRRMTYLRQEGWDKTPEERVVEEEQRRQTWWRGVVSPSVAHTGGIVGAFMLRNPRDGFEEDGA
jgi:hypothetical protein